MLALIGLTLAWIVGYAALCVVKPFGPCRRCKGAGKRANRNGRVKPCKHCRTTGLRLRVGRRIHNRASALHSAGTR